MRNALKREVAVLCGAGALACLMTRRWPLGALSLSAIGAGLWSSSRYSSFDYKGKSVVITGGSRGLGLALARHLAAQKANITLIARRADEVERAREMILKHHPEAAIETFVGDVTNKNAMASAIDAAVDRFGRLDVLINNAGSLLIGPFETMDREDFQAQMNLHLYAVIEAVKIVIPHFRQMGEGRIVNICSLGGKVAVPHMVTYDASKFALAGFSQGITSELARENIHVTTVYPPQMRTGAPVQAVFKGDHQREFEWFNAVENLPLVSMDVDQAARRILTAAADRDREVLPSTFAKIRVLSSALFPEVMQSLNDWLARKLPQDDCKHRLTGSQSRQLLLARGGTVLIDTEKEKANNQTETSSAEFNLGLH